MQKYDSFRKHGLIVTINAKATIQRMNFAKEDKMSFSLQRMLCYIERREMHKLYIMYVMRHIKK